MLMNLFRIFLIFFLPDTWPWQHTTAMDKCVAKHKPKVRISVEKQLFCLTIFVIFDPQAYLPLII